MGNSSSARREGSDTVILDDAEEESFVKSLRTNMQRLILYANSADPTLQREVAERLANEAVQSQRRGLIIQLGGLDLLVPLAQSTDVEIQRLAAHAMANLSVEVSVPRSPAPLPIWHCSPVPPLLPSPPSPPRSPRTRSRWPRRACWT